MADRPVRIVICSFGTEGDSRPLIEFATWLIARGDEVSLLLEADGAARARARGLDAAPLAGSLRDALAAPDTGDHAQTILRIAVAHVADWARAIRRAAERADVVVCSGLTGQAGQLAARAAGRPFVGISMFPVVPTAAFPPPLSPLPTPRRLNRASHQLSQRLFWGLFGRKLTPVQHAWGMPPLRLRFDDHPTLCAVSPALVPTPADWPPAARVIGELHGPRPAGSLDPRLETFLQAGPPPVYVGFGSMTVRHPDRIRAAVVSLAATRRVLFAPGWSGIEVTEGPSLLSIDNTPHDALFPRLAAVVHHGGAGTVHAAARAGIPQVVMPLGGDQSWWAQRVREAGIAGAPLALGDLTGGTLAAAVRAAEALRPRAETVAAAMAGTDGCAVAADVVHAAVTTPRPADGEGRS